ncbi:2-amino-4-hydroxy-6-hydroxymethyldihydropteridine diphosphokinase [Colwellia sp. RSH04]|uniref:2-amino-4-hydroxy-6- hydroxymethyldihydropteridine diphosphokinase n=1 Tax=Colwellia sp. RSH04 TaxID=2305464 RepID=UPI000E592236|nr:2-amino-4-hydroxy-6-hydroxymethyldihydropteridine diphosphokinase [Colwellia sp. RSH04]RHW74643.1 2-amino-4-hydroxy-6-hydroxymethyldihydropteridine diphosphokinase [Colwellia sp. RSH04]
MHRVYVSLGSNINRFQHIGAALDALDERFSPLTISKVYDCQPIGFIGDNFLNLVVGFDSQLSVGEIMNVLHEIEDNNNRQRTGPKFGARTLDIDILLYDNLVGVIDGVTLPRGEIIENAFVLLPLTDIAGDKIHPELNVTYNSLWQSYNQTSQHLSEIEFIWQKRKIS